VAVAVGVAKFALGAWMVLLLVPVLVALMLGIRRHYRDVEDALTLQRPDLPLPRLEAPRVFVPVGRLDVDTTGALLLTNDGPLAHRLAHPRYGVPKVYEAEVEGSPSGAAIAALREGVELDDGRTAPAGVRVLHRRKGSTLLELTLHEGRKHQVKRMCEAVGHPVRRLHRSRYAELDLEGLALGEWRDLSETEVFSLRMSAGLAK